MLASLAVAFAVLDASLVCSKGRGRQYFFSVESIPEGVPSFLAVVGTTNSI